MPELAVFSLKGDASDNLVLRMQKSELCTDTKVTDANQANLFNYRLPCQLKLQRLAAKEFLHSQRLDYHSSGDVERGKPFTLVEVA